MITWTQLQTVDGKKFETHSSGIDRGLLRAGLRLYRADRPVRAHSALHGRGDRMRRREFIAVLGGAAAWPLVVRAQSGRARRIGALMGIASDHLEAPGRITAFAQRLSELG